MKLLMLTAIVLLLTGCSSFKPLAKKPPSPADSTLETPVSIPTPATPAAVFQPAIDIFLAEQAVNYLDMRLGLVTNQTGVDADLNSNRQRLLAAGLMLEVLFAPEHGINGSIEAGLKVEDRHDPLTGLPVKSLYGIHTEADALAGLDGVIYDIQDIGIRPYTYISTLLRVMEASAAAGIEVIVLDRPNPLGGLLLEGSPLEEEFISFIGIAPIPYVYGLTAGELATYFKREMQIDCELTVVMMSGWLREQHFGELPLTWVPTSPNLPQWETAYYCATTGGIGELGQFNLGVGTPLPFQVIGAPWLDPYRLISFLEEAQLPSVRFLPHFYRPTWGKFAEELIPGVLIRITDFNTYQPFLTQLHLLYFLYQMYPDHNLFRTSVASKVQMFDKAMGSDKVRLALEAGATPDMILRDSQIDLLQFRRVRDKYLIYP
jgi:uncharacterized protein YbbC (DUF1343 family)